MKWIRICFLFTFSFYVQRERQKEQPINPTVNFWKFEIELQTACFVTVGNGYMVATAVAWYYRFRHSHSSCVAPTLDHFNSVRNIHTNVTAPITKHIAHTQHSANDAVLSHFWLFPLNWRGFRWFNSVNRRRASAHSHKQMDGRRTAQKIRTICNTIKTSGESCCRADRQPVHGECDTPLSEIYTLIRTYTNFVLSNTALNGNARVFCRLCTAENRWMMVSVWFLAIVAKYGSQRNWIWESVLLRHKFFDSRAYRGESLQCAHLMRKVYQCWSRREFIHTSIWFCWLRVQWMAENGVHLVVEAILDFFWLGKFDFHLGSDSLFSFTDRRPSSHLELHKALHSSKLILWIVVDEIFSLTSERAGHGLTRTAFDGFR